MTVESIIVAPQVRDLHDLEERLCRWMHLRLPEAENLRLGNFAYPSGAGRSHETILFDANWTERGTRREMGLVVRIKPTDHSVFPDDLFEQQYRIMTVLHDEGRVRVAKVFWTEEDSGLIGAPFFVMEKLSGRVAVNAPPYARSGWLFDAAPADRRKVWENGVRQLAAIQTVPVSEAPFLAGPGGLSGLEQEWDKYERFLAWVSEDRRWPILDRAMAALREGWPVNRPEGIVWGDARLGNLMFDDQLEVVAVMDWEQPSLGGALHDLAWWIYMDRSFHGETPDRPHLAGMGSREETIALWQQVCGKATDDIQWYEAFTGLKTAVLNIRMSRLKGLPPPEESVLAAMLSAHKAR